MTANNGPVKSDGEGKRNPDPVDVRLLLFEVVVYLVLFLGLVASMIGPGAN